MLKISIFYIISNINSKRQAVAVCLQKKGFCAEFCAFYDFLRPTEKGEEAGFEVASASLPLMMSGHFLAKNDVLLGIYMFGAYSSEIVWGAAVMIEAGLRLADIKEIVFPHPTVGEVIRSTLFQF